ncbi:translation initiation factor IF-2-like [Sturnira hondurensis]|uniref:translation initiation factor IF-2-like n=1 Tax=Sturnira hondurensis TaxID=192404 RepID=UPI00187A4789|nr:translation initiation factor IF-2-like [Sturnira hondurensis]
MPGPGSRRQGSRNPPASPLCSHNPKLRFRGRRLHLPDKTLWKGRQIPYLGGGAQPGRDPGTQGVMAGLRSEGDRLPGPQKRCRFWWSLGLPGHRRRGPTEAQAVQACGGGARRDSDARIPGGEGGRLCAVRGSDAPRLPRGFLTAGGSDAGPRTPGPALPAGGGRTPWSEAELERPAAGPRPPCGPPPCPAPPHLSSYLSVSRAARPSPALRGASSPPLLNGAASGAPASPTRPIERATRQRLASRAPSHRGGAPWRRRRLLQWREGPLTFGRRQRLNPGFFLLQRPAFHLTLPTLQSGLHLAATRLC